MLPTLAILSALAVTLTAGGGILVGTGNGLGWTLITIGAGWLGILYGTLLRMLAVLLTSPKEDTDANAV